MQTIEMPPKTAPEHGRLDLSRIAQDLQIRKVQVESVVQLLDEGNTVPFITRYRKERTGGLDEELIRVIQARIAHLRALAERKQTILKSIEGQGKLTEELRNAILAADTPRRLEDLYLPFKPKKKSLATAAREKGLEPLALAIWSKDPTVANLTEILSSMVNPEKGLNTPEDVLTGVQHILAETIAEQADIRGGIRHYLWDCAKLVTSKSDKVKDNEGLNYKDYFNFTEPVRHVPPHRIMAINRGEKGNVLQAKLDFDQPFVKEIALNKLPLADHPHAEFLVKTTEDALTRLLLPSLEREIRRELTGHAEDHAVSVFARNLRSLLLAPPLRDKRVLAIDPGLRTGCKVAVLDPIGTLLEETVIFPHKAAGKKEDARIRLEQLVRKHQVQVIAIGNGTGCREAEELVAGLIDRLERRRRGEPEPPPPAPPPPPAAATPEPAAPAAPEQPPQAAVTTEPASSPAPTPEQPVQPAEAAPAPATEEAPQQAVVETPPAPAAPPAPPTPSVAELLAGLPDALPELAYIIVNEAGASVYSASPVGREEFPNFDATTRGTISIGRRLQDPLSELVKIEPQNIGVGLYQHDVNPKYLKESLEGVIESCVNTVGVDLNTASVPLLRHVSGMNQLVASAVVEYRKANGPFRKLDQLIQVPGIGEARYTQAAGFLKIAGDEPLDGTWIHPESYPAARQILNDVGFAPESLSDREKLPDLQEKLKALSPEEVAHRLNIGAPTCQDILEALAKPGRDPREDLPPPVFKKGILKLEDLQAGMELKGTVLNVVDFGAFVDIGLKDSGLVHISQMANRYVKSPYDVTAVGDVVKVWVLKVDLPQRHVSLTMIPPGTERKPPERRPPHEHRPPRGEQQGQPPPERQGAAPQGDRGPPRGARRPPPAQQGQGGGQGQDRRGPPPRRQGPPPRRPQHAHGQGGPATGHRESGPPPQQPPPPPRKPRKPTPLPKLSDEALSGKSSLGTFAELAAFFEARKPKPEEPPPPAAPQVAPQIETVATAPPAPQVEPQVEASAPPEVAPPSEGTQDAPPAS